MAPAASRGGEPGGEDRELTARISARARHVDVAGILLAAGQTVVVLDAGRVVEVRPDGSRRVVDCPSDGHGDGPPI